MAKLLPTIESIAVMGSVLYLKNGMPILRDSDLTPAELRAIAEDEASRRPPDCRAFTSAPAVSTPASIVNQQS